MNTEFADMSEADRMKHFVDGSGIVGKRIVKASYTSNEDMDASGWSRRGVELELEDGTVIILMQDDEGNGPGAAVVIHPNSGETYLPVF